jgi:NNP family nitrate/nitrite transporter-like MFS transporter
MFWVSAIATLILSLPSGISPVAFILVVFVLGFVMSLGKAAVYKHIPAYYPDRIGAVGGVVGMVGGLGGFVLPIAFGLLKDATGLWSSCFLLLFAVVGVSLVWMHLSIRQMERRAPSVSAFTA